MAWQKGEKEDFLRGRKKKNTPLKHIYHQTPFLFITFDFQWRNTKKRRRRGNYLFVMKSPVDLYRDDRKQAPNEKTNPKPKQAP